MGPLSSTDTIISKTVSPGSPLELGTAPVSVYGQSLCNITTEWVGTIWQIVILSTELYYLLAHLVLIQQTDFYEQETKEIEI